MFAGRDSNDVSFELVAEEAGVSRGLVYSYFGDRGGLFAAAYEHELERLDEALDGALEAIGTDEERIARAVSAYLHFAEENPDTWRLISSAGASRHPAIRSAVDKRTEKIAESISADPSARIVVRAVVGMLEAAALQIIDDGADPTALANLLTRVIWDGVSSLSAAS